MCQQGGTPQGRWGQPCYPKQSEPKLSWEITASFQQESWGETNTNYNSYLGSVNGHPLNPLCAPGPLCWGTKRLTGSPKVTEPALKSRALNIELEWKSHEDMGGCSSKNPRRLEQCLLHGRHSINTCGRNGWRRPEANLRTKVQFVFERKGEEDATFIDCQGKLKVIKDGGRRFTRMRDFHWNIDLEKIRLNRTILKPGEMLVVQG